MDAVGAHAFIEHVKQPLERSGSEVTVFDLLAEDVGKSGCFVALP